MPKIHSPDDLHTVSRQITTSLQSLGKQGVLESHPINIVASIESAKALFNIGQIAGWKSELSPGSGNLAALLVRISTTLLLSLRLNRHASSQQRIVRKVSSVEEPWTDVV